MFHSKVHTCEHSYNQCPDSVRIKQAGMAATAPKYIETMLIFSPETVDGLVPQISTSRLLSLSSVFSVTTNGP